MRKIKYLVVHCTATPQSTSVASIQNYWKNNLKWKSPGYHIIITSDGTKIQLASEDKITNGVAGYNTPSLHVSYIGGIDSKGKPLDTRTDAQRKALLEVLKYWKSKYPEAIIQGHKDFPGVNKACPSFDAKKEYENIK